MASSSWSLTEHLLTLNPDAYKSATQSLFLRAAAEGKLPKFVLGRWLANDRLYIHNYVKAAGRMLDSIELPQTVPPAPAPPSPETELVDWIAETLVGLRREERLFIDVARRYGLDINLELGEGEGDGGAPGPSGRVQEWAKLPGLTQFEALFASVSPRVKASPDGLAARVRAPLTASSSPPELLPWLEGAVVLWGTERVYLDAWSWARAQQGGGGATSSASFEDDADGGAARKEFIPNWTSPEFSAFVDRLGRILDRAVSEALVGQSEEGTTQITMQLAERVLGTWSALLAAEAAFWPPVE